MEINTNKQNSFNSSLKPNINAKPQNRIQQKNSTYLAQIKELLKRRQTDHQKNDYPFLFQKKEEGKQLNLKLIPKTEINSSMSNNKNNRKISPTSLKTSKLTSSYKSISINTQNFVFCPHNNVNANIRKFKQVNKETIIEKFLTNGSNGNKTNSTSNPEKIMTNESNGNNTYSYNIINNYKKNLDKNKWKVINTEILFNNSNYCTRKIIAFEKYLTTNVSPIRSSYQNNPVTLDKIKSLFVEYKQRRYITKSKSGEWLCNILPSLLYKSKRSFSKYNKKNSYVYPSNKL